MVGLIQAARPEHVALFLAGLEPHAGAAVDLLRATLHEAPDDQTDEAETEMLAKRQTNAAVALLRLGYAEPVWPLLRHRPDPRIRSYLVHRLAATGVEPAVLARRLEAEPDVSARRALILSLGQYDPKQLTPALRETLAAQLLDMHAADPDAGIHAAAEWVLRRWGQAPSQEGSDAPPAAARVGRPKQWYITPQGHTLIALGPDEFLMGSPGDEEGRRGGNEVQHRRRIPRRFALATKEVTVGQFHRFYRQEMGRAFSYEQEYTMDPLGPQTAVTWYLAAQYCNWLSQQEGLPPDQWCYQQTTAQGKSPLGIRPVEDLLDRTGYRLPTEAEWEYACRAGAITARYFGQTEELLAHYAWYQPNSDNRAHEVGALEPNDFGLFDMHGNVYEWCHRLLKYPQQDEAADDRGGLNLDDCGGLDLKVRPLRGGAFKATAPFARAALRYQDVPDRKNSNFGFRVARTLR